ncbi:MAG: SLC13 family permease, partial [Nanoarchaeota archaeon]
VVPSAAVRLALLIPTVKTIVEKAGEKGENENIRRMFVVGLVFGVTVTGSGILPAALANVITVDLIAELTGVRIYYNEWLLYILPVSLSLMPVLWIILMKTFPPEIKEFPGGVKEYRQKLTQLGPLKIEEKKCLLIIFLTLVLWLTEKYHGLHTAVPAMIAVILLGMPRVGYMKWEKMLDIEWSTILLVGFTLSLGTILNETGTAEYLAGQLFKILSFEGIVFTPVAAVLIIAAFTQIMHKFLGNVTTVLVTLIPLVVEISSRMEVDPVLLGVVTGVSGLYGFLLPVETIAGIIIFGTGLLHPLEMIKPGIFLTIASITALTLAAYFWWPVVGLI